MKQRKIISNQLGTILWNRVWRQSGLDYWEKAGSKLWISKLSNLKDLLEKHMRSFDEAA
jgi:hypothetical protein